MNQFEKDIALMDRPEIIYRLFFPRREDPREVRPQHGATHLIEVDEGTSVGCRFYAAGKDAPNVLYFHGNGEIASDYDYVAPLYRQYEINLFVADYRGYGLSDGDPTCSAMVRDARPIFKDFGSFLKAGGY